MSVIEREKRVEVQREVTTADVLHRAADLLEEFGWCQHGFGGKAVGLFCLVGAINEAAYDFGLSHNIHYYGLFGYAERLLGFEWPDTWNDAPGRTKEEVVTALREAANRA